MAEIKHKSIDGFKYAMAPMGAIAANNLLIKLVSHLGTALVAILAKADDDFVDALRDGAAMALAKLEPAIAEDLLLSAMQGLQCEGVGSVRQNFDEHFRGRLLSAYRVWAWCLEVNYQDFFAAAQPQFLSALGSMKGSTADSPTQTPTPKSGDSAQPERAST